MSAHHDHRRVAPALRRAAQPAHPKLPQRRGSEFPHAASDLERGVIGEVDRFASNAHPSILPMRRSLTEYAVWFAAGLVLGWIFMGAAMGQPAPGDDGPNRPVPEAKAL